MLKECRFYGAGDLKKVDFSRLKGEEIAACFSPLAADEPFALEVIENLCTKPGNINEVLLTTQTPSTTTRRALEP